MCKIVTKKEFEDTMENFQGNEVWLSVITDTVQVGIFYESFEDEENISKELLIKKNDIYETHRDTFAPTLNYYFWSV